MPGKNKDPRRPLVIAGANGGGCDRLRALSDLAQHPDVDVIVGDWMFEGNMTVRGAAYIDAKKPKPPNGNGGVAKDQPVVWMSNTLDGYDPYFLEQLEPSLPHLAKNGIRLICNAGGSNPGALAEAVRRQIKEAQLSLDVAWIDGDDVSNITFDLLAKGEKFPHLPTGQNLKDWEFDPICAQCYLGGTSVAKALESGADIIVCGRISDASGVTGASLWWYDWTREQNLDELAGALIAGHCTECSTYVSGGCYSGFKSFEKKYTDIGFPIVYIDSNGEFEITLEDGKQGEISVGTVTAQLLYEIQGPLYYNSDVVAQLEGIKITPVSQNRVRVAGVKGLPPPPTTKVGITAKGGYRAEFHYYLTGLDIKEKIEMVEIQTKAAMGENLKKFHCLEFIAAGTSGEDPQSQNEATVDLRIFAQSRDPSMFANDKFAYWCKVNLMQGYPGATPNTDIRQSTGRPYFEYWVTLLPQAHVIECVHLSDGSVKKMPSPTLTKEYPRQQPSYDSTNPMPLDSWGPTTRAPLGYVVMARSGDKSSDANVGFFVRFDDEWDWLRSLLSFAEIKRLLGNDYTGKPIDRFEIPGVRAVHFLLWDHLDRGYNSTSQFDSLGKNLCEYLRAKHVDIPNRFLDRGRI